MPIVAEASNVVLAASRGPALAGARGRLRVHSVFRSVVNLRVEGSDILVALCGPDGAWLPHALCLREAQDFSRWPAPGAPGALSPTRLAIGGRSGRIVDLRGAVAKPREEMPDIEGARGAWSLCVGELERLQGKKACELRIGCVLGRLEAPTEMGSLIAARARALGSAVLGQASSIDGAVASLIGAGQGLTPAGDDFLCGFMAATRSRDESARLDGARYAISARQGRGLALRVAEAVDIAIDATTDISASMLRCAGRGLFALPLVELARALARDEEESALGSLAQVTALGHSSGADAATGFLYGIGLLTGALSARDGRVARGRRRYAV